MLWHRWGTMPQSLCALVGEVMNWTILPHTMENGMYVTKAYAVNMVLELNIYEYDACIVK